MSDFSPDNAVAVNQNSKGTTPADTGSFNVDNAVPVNEANSGATDWEKFSTYKTSSPDSNPEGSELENPVASAVSSGQPIAGQPSKDKPNVSTTSKAASQVNQGATKGQSNEPVEDNVSREISSENTGKSGQKPHSTVPSPDYPPENWLNATYHLAAGNTWRTFMRPFDKNPQDMDEYLAQLDKKHPIASVVTGTAPFIVAAPFLPESLVPNVYLRTAAQFGMVGFGTGLNRAKSDPSQKITDKASDVAQETLKQMAFGPVFAKAQTLKILDRPFQTALARAGVIAGGSGVMSTMFGDNIQDAFKQGGLCGALSLLTESPHLAGTVLGRGLIAHTNSIAADIASKTGVPYKTIEPDSPDVAQQAHDAAELIGKQLPGVDKPQIVSATVKLPDGTQIHGASHDDALNKIGMKKYDGLVVANIGADGKIYKGSPGDLHYNLNEKYADKIRQDMQLKPGDPTWNKTGFLDKEGNFLTREDALSKTKVKSSIGNMLDASDYREQEGKKSGAIEGKDFEAGFTVVEPNGKSKFITREESKQEPFNLPHGISEDVKGLNESKWMDHKEPKITNPDTLAMIKNNEGKMDINMIPGAAELSEIIPKSIDEMVKTFVPPDVSDPAKFTAMATRQYLGIMARNRDQFFDAMEKARHFFNKATKESITENYTKSEHGEALDSPELQKIFDAGKRALRQKAEEVQAKTGKLNNLIDNYLTHAWEKPGKAKQLFASIFGKRPFEGGKSFMKKRTIEDFATGIEAGLTPISWNPVDLWMFKLNEMDRYLMAHQVKEALKDKDLRVFVRTGGEKPEGWTKINDPAEEVYYTNDAKELVKSGVWYTHPDAARIIDNYLSPGLRHNYLYNLYRSASNTLIQARLSLSAFHAQFVTNDANISSFSLGLNKIGAGMVKEGVADMAKSAGFFVAPIQTVAEGMKLNEAWHGRSNDATTNFLASLYAKGGGRASMDRYYAIESDKAINNALKEGKYLTAAFHTPFWLLQQFMRPIMEFFVPRMKMGVFANLMKFEIDKNPEITETQLLSKAQLAVDTVDDRMGQLVYDNLFINKTLKDLGMASVQSFGWNIGDVRLFGGGAVDLVKSLNQFRQGKGGDLSYRLSYVMAMPIVMGYYGAVYQYLHTGKKPGEGIEKEGISGILKDLYFPRNGGTDQRGNPARTSLADYVKDVYHFAQDPLQTAINKLNPINDEIMSMIRNKDFYNTKIYNEDDPWPQQWKDLMGYAVTSNISYSVQSMMRSTNKSLENKVESFFGFNTAPLDINMTSAEREARTLSLAHMSPASRTKQEAQHSQAKSQLFADYVGAGKDVSVLDKAVTEGTISNKEKRQMVKQVNMSNLERWTKDLTFEEVFHVLNKGNPSKSEKRELEKILDKKRGNKEKRGTWDKDEEELYARSVAMAN